MPGFIDRHPRRARRPLGAIAAVLALLTCWAAPATAFPVRNGVIAVVPAYEDCEYYGARPPLQPSLPTAWAANGETICSDYQRGIALVAPYGGSVRLLPLEHSNRYLRVRFSGDGRFLSWNDGSAYWVSTALGTGERRIASCSGDCSASWSPVDATLVVTQDRRLVRFAVDTGQRRTLGLGRQAVWSPGARVLGYVRGRRVMRMRPDGRDARQLATLPAAANDPRTVGWSTDGRHVLVAAYNENLDRDRLYAIDVRTGSVRLTRPPRFEGVRSPDGRLRAFAGRLGVYTSRPDGSARRRILGPPARFKAEWYEVGDWQPLR